MNRSMHLDDRSNADRILLVHKFQSFVDVVERDLMRDELVELELLTPEELRAKSRTEEIQSSRSVRYGLNRGQQRHSRDESTSISTSRAKPNLHVFWSLKSQHNDTSRNATNQSGVSQQRNVKQNQGAANRGDRKHAIRKHELRKHYSAEAHSLD